MYNNYKYAFSNIEQLEDTIVKSKNGKRIKSYYITMILFIISFILLVLSIIFKLTLLVLISLPITYIFMLLFESEKSKKDFYQVLKAYKKCNLIKVKDEETIKKLYDDSSLTFIRKPSKKVIDFIYNLLYFDKLISNENIDIYVCNGKAIKKAFKNVYINNGITMLCIPNKFLNINDENNQTFADHFIMTNAKWFADFIDDNKND